VNGFSSGIPVNEDLRATYPRVFGKHDIVGFDSFRGGRQKFDAIKTVMDNGTEVWIDVTDVRPESERRHERTVLS
jgi:hypothetical protein